MAEYEVNGVDVSYWQGDINWHTMASKIDFAFIRAGVGNAWVDTKLARNVDGAFSNNVPFGLYWYLKPDKDWRKHAESFAQVYLDNMGALPPVADIETTGGLDKNSLDNWLAKAVARFEEMTGVELMIYTSAGFFNANMPMTNWAKHRKLWIASWNNVAPTLPDEWVEINNPKDWTFWQWTNRGDGLAYGAQSKQLDLNRYNGSMADFEREFGVALPEPEPPPEPPPPPDEPDIIRIVGLEDGGRLNMRSGVWGEVVAQTWNDAEFDVVGSEKDAQGRLWYALAPRIWVASWYTEEVA